VGQVKPPARSIPLLLSSKGQRVLLTDLDQSAQSTKHLGLDSQQSPSLYDVYMGTKPAALAIRKTRFGIDVLSSHPLDGMPVIGKPPQSNGSSPTSLREKPVIQEEQANQAKPERANARTPVRRNGKRIITRNAFEIYEDQMDTLRKLSLEEKMNGKLGSMSAMVREAIDAYLYKKSAGK